MQEGIRAEMQSRLSQKTAEIEKILSRFLPEETGLQKTVLSAMNYTMTAGGKRLRPLLMDETYRMYGGKDRELIEPFMAAIEMIHTYSLIHDDLPAMDNDDYRRGRKTAHVVYGEAMAILAGDALLNYAFETASKAFEGIAKSEAVCDETACNGPDHNEADHNGTDHNETDQDLQSDRNLRTARAFSVLARKPGIYGMIGGQVVDVESEGHPVSMETLLFIHKHKTAALIECAMMIGAILAGAPEEEVLAVERIADKVGLAFQIQDDILDRTATTEELGKPVGSDEKNEKNTYVSLVGLTQAQEDQKRLTEEAIREFGQLSGNNEFLKWLLLELTKRRH